MRIVYVDGNYNPPPAPQIPGTGEDTRRVPVVVIRTGEPPEEASRAGEGDRPGGPSPGRTAPGPGEPAGIDIAGTDYRLTLSEEAIARDREVRGHERDHLMTLGGYAASGITYTMKTGPGGERVAVGGRIAVDMAEVPGDPRATLQKARTIYAAATAPGNPSAADMRVAADAYRLMQEAQDDLEAERRPEVDTNA
ncbi:MAG: putative metalloprotease CJM1_0395 family protein [Spirochaetaceae bacterium]